MRKEIFYAIIAGSLFGLVIAFGIWKANTPLKSQENQTEQTAEQIDEVKNEENTNIISGITIAKPSDNQVITNQTETISGITSPNSYIIISTETDDYFIQTDNDGAFEEEVKLESGINNIQITSLTPSANINKINLTLVYSSNFAVTTTDETENSSTESADSIRKTIEAKIYEAKNTPTSYIGTVTDIAKTTIEIRRQSFTSEGKAGEIQQIATGDQTAYLKNGSSAKEIKLTDIAIGDFIIAMGYKNGNNVLDGKRIIVTDIPKIKDIQASLGNIKSVSKTDISADILPDLKPQVFDIDKETKIFSIETKSIPLTSVKVNDYMIFVTESDKENTLTTRSIFQISLTSSPTPKEKTTPTPDDN